VTSVRCWPEHAVTSANSRLQRLATGAGATAAARNVLRFTSARNLVSWAMIIRGACSMRRLTLLRSLVFAWASMALVVNVGDLFSDDMGAIETIHEIKHAVLDSTEGRYTSAVDFAEAQWQMLNRSRLWHSGTALILLAVSLWGFTMPSKDPGDVGRAS
jgi:hypothetical protein